MKAKELQDEVHVPVVSSITFTEAFKALLGDSSKLQFEGFALVVLSKNSDVARIKQIFQSHDIYVDHRPFGRMGSKCFFRFNISGNKLAALDMFREDHGVIWVGMYSDELAIAPFLLSYLKKSARRAKP
jgi:hypothetical protein